MNWSNEFEKEDLKKIYVVYNGSKLGVYTSWLETSRAIIDLVESFTELLLTE
ncbi:viroplasmin family protein [Candidatus Liberibacter asiaticus]